MPGSHLVLVKNPSYWKPGQPYLDRIIYKIVPDANALLNQLETTPKLPRRRDRNRHTPPLLDQSLSTTPPRRAPRCRAGIRGRIDRASTAAGGGRGTTT